MEEIVSIHSIVHKKKKNRPKINKALSLIQSTSQISKKINSHSLTKMKIGEKMNNDINEGIIYKRPKNLSKKNNNKLNTLRKKYDFEENNEPILYTKNNNLNPISEKVLEHKDEPNTPVMNLQRIKKPNFLMKSAFIKDKSLTPQERFQNSICPIYDFYKGNSGFNTTKTENMVPSTSFTQYCNNLNNSNKFGENMQISDYFNPSPSPLTNLSDKNNMNYYMNFSFLAKNQEKINKIKYNDKSVSLDDEENNNNFINFTKDENFGEEKNEIQNLEGNTPSNLGGTISPSNDFFDESIFGNDGNLFKSPVNYKQMNVNININNNSQNNNIYYQLPNIVNNFNNNSNNNYYNNNSNNNNENNINEKDNIQNDNSNENIEQNNNEIIDKNINNNNFYDMKNQNIHNINDIYKNINLKNNLLNNQNILNNFYNYNNQYNNQNQMNMNSVYNKNFKLNQNQMDNRINQLIQQNQLNQLSKLNQNLTNYLNQYSKLNNNNMNMNNINNMFINNNNNNINYNNNEKNRNINFSSIANAFINQNLINQNIINRNLNQLQMQIPIQNNNSGIFNNQANQYFGYNNQEQIALQNINNPQLNNLNNFAFMNNNINNFNQNNNNIINNQVNNNIQNSNIPESFFYSLTPIQLAQECHIIAKNQNGCRYLQNMISANPEILKNLFFPKILEHIKELSNNQFANYLVKKIFQYLSEDMLLELIQSLVPVIDQIGTNQYGTRVIQDLIDFLKTEKVFLSFVNIIIPHAKSLIIDLNGSHIIYKLILTKNKGVKIIENIICMYVKEIAITRKGCSFLKRYFEFANENDLIKIKQSILQNLKEIITDQYGNYVIQSILTKEGSPIVKDFIIEINKNLIFYSNNKFSSNALEKCFENENMKNIVLDQLLNKDTFEKIILDKFGNYVVQKAIAKADDNRRNYMLQLLIPLIPSLKSQYFGKRLLSKLALQYPNLNIN